VSCAAGRTGDAVECVALVPVATMVCAPLLLSGSVIAAGMLGATGAPSNV